MSIGSAIKGFFVGIWHLLKPVEQDALAQFEAKITPDVLDAVRAGLTAAAAQGLGDTAARDTAIATAIADLTAAGKSVVDIAKSEWNAIVEILYTAGKSEIATVAAKVPTPATPAA